ncbi:MAG: hypothetical protein KF885_05580 [Anaerolineales bacterium]|nr:hypothetical protein [Anaerolineales bacterium]
MKRILLICTANICRSPMAEGFLKELAVSKSFASNWHIESAGTWGQPGLPAAAGSLNAMQARNINISQHRSRIVSAALIAEADLILTMESGHKEALQIEFPEKRDCVYQLSELIGEEFDIEDPIGQSLQRFERTANEIKDLLIRGLPTIASWLEAGNGNKNPASK